MPRRFPSYPRAAHRNGQARIRLHGRDVYLGPHGSPQSWAEYERLMAEWRAGMSVSTIRAKDASQPVSGAVKTVNDLVLTFWEYATTNYSRRDGQPATELGEYRLAIRPLRRLYGHVPVREFGPLALEAVQRAMADGTWLTPAEHLHRRKIGKPARWSRLTSNKRVARLKRIWKWAASRELIPVEYFDRLRTVEGIPAGRGLAIEHAPVGPVPHADLIRTLRALHRTARSIALTQMLTGARPGEIVNMRPADLVRSGPVDLELGVRLDAGKVWVYRPRTHKTQHRGQSRVILIGPKAQAVLKPFLEGRDAEAFVFSPREVRESMDAERKAGRQTPMTPSQARRKPKRHKRKWPGQRYTVTSYGRAIRDACLAHGIPLWHPHQLRHNAASKLVRDFGWEIARVVLGQKSISATRIYAVDGLSKAAEALKKVG